MAKTEEKASLDEKIFGSRSFLRKHDSNAMAIMGSQQNVKKKAKVAKNQDSQ